MYQNENKNHFFLFNLFMKLVIFTTPDDVIVRITKCIVSS